MCWSSFSCVDYLWSGGDEKSCILEVIWSFPCGCTPFILIYIFSSSNVMKNLEFWRSFAHHVFAIERQIWNTWWINNLQNPQKILSTSLWEYVDYNKCCGLWEYGVAYISLCVTQHIYPILSITHTLVKCMCIKYMKILKVFYSK